MTFDVIVFNQKELDDAVLCGFTSIALCDGDFLLPSREDITYVLLGGASAKKASDNTSDTMQNMPPASASSISSFRTSYFFTSYFLTSYTFTSYFLTSYTLSSYFVTSYEYEYEYEYVISSSYTTSYLTSYTSSYTSSYASSYTGGYIPLPETNNEEYAEKREECVCVMVNGYGINLI